MYGIFTYIWVIFGVNVGKYSIHGASGIHHDYLMIGCKVSKAHNIQWVYQQKHPENFLIHCRLPSNWDINEYHNNSHG